VVFVIRPGEPHQLWPALRGEPFQTLWWYVTASGVNLALAGVAGRAFIARVGFVALDLSPAPLVARLVRELEARRPHFNLAARALLLELAIAVLRGLDEAGQAAQPVYPGQAPSGEHVTRVAQYVNAHHGPDITLKRVAEVFGLSPHYLTALFQRHTGRSLMAHVNDVRHREALALLRETDLPVAEVARAVGYRDPYYFSRVFKARQGSAPQSFRQTGRARLSHAGAGPGQTEGVADSR
jgi:AraC-like DNA-binding protein